jgi:hypothetical protein
MQHPYFPVSGRSVGHVRGGSAGFGLSVVYVGRALPKGSLCRALHSDPELALSQVQKPRFAKRSKRTEDQPRVEFAKANSTLGCHSRHPHAAGQPSSSREIRKALPLMTVPGSVSM